MQYYLKLTNLQQRAIAAYANLHGDNSSCASSLRHFINTKIFSGKNDHRWKPEILLGYLEYYVHEKNLEPCFLIALEELLTGVAPIKPNHLTHR